jgi:FKBP-type peptidyl-prolyl cis-trans isomerase
MRKPYPCSPVKSLVKIVLSVAAGFLFVAPVLRAQREKLPPEDVEYVEKNWPEAKKTNTGIRYIVLREGQGTEKPKPGDKCQVLYVGRLLNGTIFDQATEPSQPFTFRVRRDEVIEGWDQIIQQMKKGEKRLVIVPPEYGYGTRGQPPKIPRAATLVFEMELIEFGKN